MKQVDICVIGGGNVGLVAALAMAHAGHSVLVCDKGPLSAQISDDIDIRVSALNGTSVNLLSTLGVWQHITQHRHAPYTKMQVKDADSFAEIDFASQDIQQSALGYIVENQCLRYACLEVIARSQNITLSPNTVLNDYHALEQGAMLTTSNGPVIAKTTLACDGAESKLRSLCNIGLTFWDYDHHAIVTTLKTEKSHHNTARQVFTPDGPIAFLPLEQSDLCSIVWSATPEKVTQLTAMDDGDFAKAIAAEFDMQLGMCEQIGKRAAFPLRMRYAKQFVQDAVVLVGDAAHTIHPLAGLGLNLGLSDVNALMQLAMAEQGWQSGNHLARYERARKADAQIHIGLMQGLKTLFAGNNPLKKLLRGVGLCSVNRLTPLKHILAKHALGEPLVDEAKATKPSVNE